MNQNAYAMIESDRIGQYTSKSKAGTAARLETSRTGVKHYAMLNTCYRVGNDGFIIPRTCWTIRISKGSYQNCLDASQGSYPGGVWAIA